MIVKFFPKGRCGLDYVLGTNRKNDTRQPTVIAGDPAQVRGLIAGMDSKNPFTSCALTYEREITPAEAARDIRSFEVALFPGLDPTSWARLWVRHAELAKDPVTKQILPGGRVRTALHLIIPNVHLPTGKHLQPFWKGADFKRIEAWQEITNAERGYTSPKDPSRRRDIFISSRLPQNIGALKKTLNATINEAITHGEITSREELCSWLENLGFEIARVTKKSISISRHDLKKNLRLEGQTYEHDGIAKAVGTKTPELYGGDDRSGASRSRRNEELERYHRIFAASVERKRRELFEKYERRSRGRASPLDAVASRAGGKPMEVGAGEPSHHLHSLHANDAVHGHDVVFDAAHRASPRPATTPANSTFSTKPLNYEHDHHHTTTQHTKPESVSCATVAHGNVDFGFFEAASLAVRQVGKTIEEFAIRLRARPDFKRNDNSPIPSLALGNRAVAALSRLFVKETERHKKLMDEKIRVHIEKRHLEERDNQQREQSDWTPSLP